MAKKILNIKTALLMIIAALFLLLPVIFQLSNYVVGVLTTCFLFAALGLSWNIVAGYGGQISWCHAAFVAIGGYTGIILFNNFYISPFIGILVAMAISYAFATIIGTATAKFKGSVFAITTIAFAELLRVILLNTSKLTGGAAGITLKYNRDLCGVINIMFDNNKPYYYICFAVMLIALLIMTLFTKSKTGYYLSVIKGDQDAAQSLGINVQKIKLRSFQISAMMAAAVGVVYCFYLSFADPYTTCGMDLSIKIGAVAILGGLGTIAGPVVGAFIIIPLIELSSSLLGASGGTQVFYGLALILIMLFRPSGIVTLMEPIKAFLNRHKDKKGKETA